MALLMQLTGPGVLGGRCGVGSIRNVFEGLEEEP